MSTASTSPRLADNPAVDRVHRFSKRIAFDTNHPGGIGVVLKRLIVTSHGGDVAVEVGVVAVSTGLCNESVLNYACARMRTATIAVALCALLLLACSSDNSEELAQPSPTTPSTATPAATGRRIAFASDRDGNPEIYVINADGSNQTRITDNPEFDSFPSWSPDGRRIAFDSERDGTAEIYVMNADGSNQTNLTNNPAWDSSSSWSPDSSRIAFVSTRDGSKDLWGIYVMNADGSNPTRLTNNTASDYSPSWSPVQ